MPRIKDLCAQIRAKLTDEQSELNGVLKQIENEAYTILGDLESAKNDATEWKEKAENAGKDSQKTIKDLTKERDDLKAEAGKVAGLQSQVDELTGFKDQIIKSQHDGFKKFFASIKDHPRFEKVAGRFPDVPFKKGSKTDYDWDKISDEDYEKGIKAMNDLNEIEYFGEIKGDDQGTRRVDGDRFQQRTDKIEAEKIESEKDMHDYVHQEAQKIASGS